MKQKALINSLVRSEDKELNLLTNVVLMVVGAMFLALFAQLRVVLPFTPVPITGQTLAVSIIALLYGKKLAPATIITYIVAGSLGAPVYAGFKAGFPLLVATGGYIIGWVVSSFIIGYLAEKGWINSFAKTVLAIILGEIVMYALGMFQLHLFVPNKNVFMVGFIPFIPGDIVKILLATSIVTTVRKVMKK